MASSRIPWIDVAKGICIVAVVSLYAAERVGGVPGTGNWMDAWVDFARPFRMPDFFLISGLFLSRVIERPWRSYLDKKAVHYLYFFALWTLIDFPFLVLAGKAGETPGAALAKLATLFYEPYAMLWFIQMLAIYFVLAKLLRGVPVWLVLALALIWQMFPIKTSAPQFDRIGERFVYFYAGYAFAPRFFALADWAQARRGAALLGLLIWAAVNGLFVAKGLSGLPGVGVALGFCGAAAVITASSLLSQSRRMAWLGALGERSIVIYLSFLFPMTALLLLIERTGWFADRGTLAALVTVFSVLGSLAFERLARGSALRYLFERPRWATLREPSKQIAPAGEFSA